MSRWSRGEADVERMVASGELQRVTGAQADGAPWIDRARVTLATASRIVADDPANAFTLAYDAVRVACTGLLAHQGLRPTTAGGHIAVERAVTAQFGAGFKPYTWLRRRRNDLEYPAFADDVPDEAEVREAIEAATAIVDAAATVLPGLGLF